ncbi:MAG TPA: chromate efflux transporter, partial [Rectinemataceae bacterium]|nr:chromate efflux transporter [Rectinemataceae bacterium]
GSWCSGSGDRVGADPKGEARGSEDPRGRKSARLLRLIGYFLRLGTLGFGGPVALVGYMHRDLVEARGWIGEDDYRLALALAQIMPGPLAAQTAIGICYFDSGLAGATLGGIAFVLPSFLIVVAISILYVAFGGSWWMQSLFYGIGAAIIAIVAIAALKLARTTNRRDPLSWGIFAVLMATTYFTRTELAWVFIVAGLVALLVRAPPRWLCGQPRQLALSPVPAAIGATALATPLVAGSSLLTLFLFFLKAGAFVFGSGLAIVPFLHQGVVEQYRWLSERQFLDAVAVAMITPGPVVITVVFIGYIVARLPGALVSAIGIFLPVYLFTIVPALWFRRHRDDPHLKAFVQGVTAAATGAIAGAVVILGEKAISDIPTAAIALVSLAMLWFLKLPEPILVLVAGAVGVGLRIIGGHVA